MNEKEKTPNLKTPTPKKAPEVKEVEVKEIKRVEPKKSILDDINIDKNRDSSRDRIFEENKNRLSVSKNGKTTKSKVLTAKKKAPINKISR